jgi:hypothetical protein
LDDQTTYFIGLFLLLLGGWTVFQALRTSVAFSGKGVGGASRKERPVLYWLTVGALCILPLGGLCLIAKLFFPHLWE